MIVTDEMIEKIEDNIPCPSCSDGMVHDSVDEYLCDSCGSHFNYKFMLGWREAHEKFYKILNKMESK